MNNLLYCAKCERRLRYCASGDPHRGWDTPRDLGCHSRWKSEAKVEVAKPNRQARNRFTGIRTRGPPGPLEVVASKYGEWMCRFQGGTRFEPDVGPGEINHWLKHPTGPILASSSAMGADQELDAALPHRIPDRT